MIVDAFVVVVIGGLGSIGVFGLWLVPGAVIAGPGLLALIWLAIQVMAGMAWLPAARLTLRPTERARLVRSEGNSLET